MEDEEVDSFHPLHSMELTHGPYSTQQLLRADVVREWERVVVHAGYLGSAPDDLLRSTV